MKRLNNIQPWMIAGGLFVVIGLLASICAVFPEEGINLGEEYSLRFPNLTEMLEGDASSSAESQLTPEELLAQRGQELKRLQEEQQFVEYFTNNPARIHFPDDSVSYFDSFYFALLSAVNQGVRVVHFGDSQIEADRISCVLRETLQGTFGGGGNGILPMQESLWSMTTNIYSSKASKRYQIYGPSSNRREGNNWYGPMGNVAILDSIYSLSVSPKKQTMGSVPANYFNRVTVLSSGLTPLRMSIQGKSSGSEGSSAALRFTHINLPDSTTNCTITLSGHADIYGIMLDNRTGVSVDNIPMRGCSGTIFTSIQSAQLKAYFGETNTQLIILQFGGNSMPYIKTQQAIDNYVNSLRRQVRHIQSLAPQAKILWIGPSDMSTRINGKMQTYPMLQAMDSSICKMVTEEGGAYWSLFESMGGNGSMIRWAHATPSLAGNDYVHFTRLGAQKAGQLLTDAIMTCYRYFLFRHPDAQITEASEEPYADGTEYIETPKQYIQTIPFSPNKSDIASDTAPAADSVSLTDSVSLDNFSSVSISLDSIRE